ncbi:MAG: biopolymer transporter ExbD [Candidatus Eremiobacteraeota bacterium]|nr:biopolymer transporter ExbD [Candidatus Eremiobacteraeota bacterium]
MMKLKKPVEKDMNTLNLTSMTDVLLTLLIMFMVAETAGTTWAFNMNLPKVVSLEKADDPSVLISYTAKRKLWVTTSITGDIQVQRENLKVHLARIKGKYNFEKVIIKADKSIRYKEVIAVMDDAKRAGFDSISLATEI